MDLSKQLMQLVDRGHRVEVKGRVVEDPAWQRDVVSLPPQLPEDLILPADHELLPREIVRMRFWKDGETYRCTEIRTTVYEGKPELILS
jgi:hypothetical protein